MEEDTAPAAPSAPQELPEPGLVTDAPQQHAEPTVAAPVLQHTAEYAAAPSLQPASEADGTCSQQLTVAAPAALEQQPAAAHPAVPLHQQGLLIISPQALAGGHLLEGSQLANGQLLANGSIVHAGPLVVTRTRSNGMADVPLQADAPVAGGEQRHGQCELTRAVVASVQ